MMTCGELHRLLNGLERHSFPFSEGGIPANGVYVLFERGERAHGADRIVRAGTHTGENQLRSRLMQHFVVENKDRSILRKNIGRAILNRDSDPFLGQWDLDLTTRAMRERHGGAVDKEKMADTERRVSDHIRKNMGFAAFRVEGRAERLVLESKMASTLSLCGECRPSGRWLGNHSPKKRIRESGLWQVNELYKKPLNAAELGVLSSALGGKPKSL